MTGKKGTGITSVAVRARLSVTLRATGKGKQPAKGGNSAEVTRPSISCAPFLMRPKPLLILLEESSERKYYSDKDAEALTVFPFL